MAKSINACRFLGNVGKDPESRFTSNNTQVATFSLACGEKYKDRDGQWQERTEWINCVAWAKLAEIVEKYVHKGDRLYVEGKLQTRSWEQNGERKYKTEVVLSEIVLLGGNGQRSEASGARETGAGRNPGYTESDQITDEDIPF